MNDRTSSKQEFLKNIIIIKPSQAKFNSLFLFFMNKTTKKEKKSKLPELSIYMTYLMQ